MPRLRIPLAVARAPFAIGVATLVLAACRDVDPAVPDERTAMPTAPQAVATAPHPGRSLAANCFQCHGTNGVAGELKIAGESRAELVSELNEMRAEDPRRNIMNVHAVAYTPAEITLIADYFSKQGQ